MRCLEDEDCGPAAYCTISGCEPSPLTGPVFEPYTPIGLETFKWRPRDVDTLGFGPGFALFDMNGDGLPDLFTGRYAMPDSAACIWRNESTPGVARFVPVEDLCSGELGDAFAAWGVDLDGDGRDELLLLREGGAELLRFEPEFRRLAIEHPRLNPAARRPCIPGAVAPLDVTLDGRLELVLGCQAGSTSNEPAMDYDWENIILRQTDEGGLVPLNEEGHELLVRNDATRELPGGGQGGCTLALGLVDINDNGLLDVVLANDAFSTLFRRNQFHEQGYAAIRCSPTEACTWRWLPVGSGTTGWGAFMGVGTIRVDDEDWIYLTDWGPNRLVRWTGEGLVSESVPRLADLGRRGGTLLFAWGVQVDDFSGNGLDDILVTQGAVPGAERVEFMAHRDTLLVQLGDGTFRSHDESAGLLLPSRDRSGHPEQPTSSRNTIRADVTGGGFIDHLVGNLHGPLTFYRQVNTDDQQPVRACTLRPSPSVVPAHASGYAIAEHDSREFRVRDSQGQMRAAPPGTILSRHTRGVLRFPSGWETPFTCVPGDGPVDLVEPDWLAVSTFDGGLQIVFREWPSHRSPPEEVTAFVREAEGLTTTVIDLSPASDAGLQWTAPHDALPANAARIMLRLDGRYVARWWPVQQYAQ